MILQTIDSSSASLQLPRHSTCSSSLADGVHCRTPSHFLPAYLTSNTINHTLVLSITAHRQKSSCRARDYRIVIRDKRLDAALYCKHTIQLFMHSDHYQVVGESAFWCCWATCSQLCPPQDVNSMSVFPITLSQPDNPKECQNVTDSSVGRV